MMDDEMKSAAQALFELCRKAQLTIATAESCTGGLIAAALTSLPGASQIFTCGLVTYANRAKMKLLLVPRDLLTSEGAVSAACARAMAEGARAQTGSDLALATTGIAGPGGGTAERPVGLVYIAAAVEGETRDLTCRFGDQFRGESPREAIRKASVISALKLGCDLIAR